MRIPLLCIFPCVCLTTFLLTPRAEAQQTEPKKTPKRKPPAIEEVSKTLQHFVDSEVISGAVTLVAHQGKVIHLSGVGLSDIERKKKMSTRHIFAIASMTKPVVATGLMILEEEGLLSLDDKVSKYLPEFASLKLKDGESPSREITIRDAITHTSGLTGSQRFEGSLAEGVNKLANRPLAFEPGTKWQYSPGLNICGRIVEIVSEQRLDDYLQEKIFDPLEMNSTSFYPTAEQRKRIATLYAPGDDQGLVAVPSRIADVKVGDRSQGPSPSGGLFSTARDMFRFYQMILNDGKFRKQQIIAPGIAAKMTSPQTKELKTGFTPGNCWGLGWCIIRNPQGVTEMLSPGTFGHGGAFGTQGWVDPETETIYVLMIQRTRLPNSDGSEIRREFQQAASEAIW